eukprot:166035-Pleurochrysis_carterae.AAC.2
MSVHANICVRGHPHACELLRPPFARGIPVPSVATSVFRSVRTSLLPSKRGDEHYPLTSQVRKCSRHVHSSRVKILWLVQQRASFRKGSFCLALQMKARGRAGMFAQNPRSGVSVPPPKPGFEHS